MPRTIDIDKYIPESTFQLARANKTKPTNNVNVYSDISIITSPNSAPSVVEPRKTIQKNTRNLHLRQISSKTKWSTGKKVLLGVLIASFVCITIVAIVVAVVLTRKTAATSTIAPWTLASAYWSFDQNGNDLYGVYNGNTTASYPQSNYFQSHNYIQFGYSLQVSNQQFIVSSYFNMSYRSFTVEAWIYPTTLNGDNTIFSQCTCATCTSQCLLLILRSGRLYMGFTLNDLQGSTTLTVNAWYHVAFVYNYQTAQQILYLDGVQDSIRTNVQPYLGQNGSIIIGAQSSSGYYYGYIDNLALTTRAKSASEISNDGTLLFYYSFDLPSPFYDNGPNLLNNTAISNYASVATTSGHVNQGIQFTSTSSYFQMCCFYQLATIASKPYTFAVWIYPTSITGGAIVHVSYYYNNGGCCGYGGYGYDILALMYNGQLVTQVYYSNYFPSYVGAAISLNTWTHVACTYSSTNGVILYVNGKAQGSSGATPYTANGGYEFFVTLGYDWGYQIGNMANPAISFQGSMDEFYVYRRELSAAEILALASV